MDRLARLPNATTCPLDAGERLLLDRIHSLYDFYILV
jgi:hypothetical protein